MPSITKKQDKKADKMLKEVLKAKKLKKKAFKQFWNSIFMQDYKDVPKEVAYQWFCVGYDYSKMVKK